MIVKLKKRPIKRLYSFKKIRRLSARRLKRLKRRVC